MAAANHFKELGATLISNSETKGENDIMYSAAPFTVTTEHSFAEPGDHSHNFGVDINIDGQHNIQPKI